MRYFLEHNPAYPKTASGKLSNSKAEKILTEPLYAGYVGYEPWGVSVRKGQHEGMVSYETFCRIQERMGQTAYAPTRKDINQDFPLRGGVKCVCGNTYTSCWSKSRNGNRYAYYLCQNRKCEHKGKSIRKDVLEGEFEALLKKIVPTEKLFAVADEMFRKLWSFREANQAQHLEQFKSEYRTTEKKIEQLLDRIVETETPSVIAALEKRIQKLEDKKILLEEKVLQGSVSARPYEAMYRTAMKYLAEPHKLWAFGRFEDKRAVLKLTFSEHLVYERNKGYRTANLSLPFKMLGDFFMQEKEMVPEALSNTSYNVLNNKRNLTFQFFEYPTLYPMN